MSAGKQVWGGGVKQTAGFRSSISGGHSNLEVSIMKENPVFEVSPTNLNKSFDAGHQYSPGKHDN